MYFKLLGTLETKSDPSADLEFKASKPRLLLGMLLLRDNAVVPGHVLLEGLWGDRPPKSALPNLRTYVGRVRDFLDRGRAEADLVSCPGGYRIDLPAGGSDLIDWRAHREHGLAALGRGCLEEAAAHLRAALRLWRGAPLEGMELRGGFRAQAISLEEQHVRTMEVLYDTELRRGGHAELVSELSGVCDLYPTREAFRAQLMVSLYRSGRTADALGAYQRIRRQLVEELGVEPGPELWRLNNAILAGEPRVGTEAWAPHPAALVR